jgi:hypothetical protein
MIDPALIWPLQQQPRCTCTAEHLRGAGLTNAERLEAPGATRAPREVWSIMLKSMMLQCADAAAVCCRAALCKSLHASGQG